MSKKINFKFIFVCLLIAFFVIFAGVSIFMMSKIYGITSANYNQIIFISIACVVFVAIFTFSAKLVYGEGKNGKKSKAQSTAEPESEIHLKVEELKKQRAENLTAKAEDDSQTMPASQTPSSRPKKFSLKNLLFGIGALLGFVGISAVIFYFGLKDSNNIKKGNYIKTTATIEYESGSNKSGSTYYVFEDTEGNTITVEADSNFGGMELVSGKKIVLYYNVNNPEITTTLGAQPIMLFMGSCFLLVGVMLCLGLIFGTPNFLLPFAFAYPFVGFIVAFFVGLHKMTGLNFVELLFSGIFGYVGTCLFLIGLILFAVGIIQIPKLVRDIRLGLMLRKTQRQVDTKPKTEKPETAKKVFRFKKHLIPFLVVSIGFFIGSMFMMVGLGIVPLAKATKYEPVTATVTEVKTYEDEDGSLLANYTFRYTYNEKEYEKVSSYSQSANLVPAVGDEIVVKINPENPDEVLDSLFTCYIMLVAGGIFLIVSAVVCFLGYRTCLEPAPNLESYAAHFDATPKPGFLPEKQEEETSSSENFNK